jgi:hypothetical protein
MGVVKRRRPATLILVDVVRQTPPAGMSRCLFKRGFTVLGSGDLLTDRESHV